MQEGLKLVKEALGDDAIIVRTTEGRNGWVHITAAVEQMQSPPPKEETGFGEDEIAEMITDILLKHRVPAAVGDKIVTAAMLTGANDPREALAGGLHNTFLFRPPAKKENKPLFLVGPPGAGKTLTTAKMAARAVMDGHKPAVITTDIARAGGVEQLTAFLDILQVPLHQADDAKALEKVLAQTKGTPVIIDTGGLNPFDPQEMKTLARLMAVTPMDAALVLPAGLDAEESAEMAMTFSVLGVKNLIPTRLDFARRIGGILCAADTAKLTLGDASHTPQVANGLVALTPQKLAELLMPALPVKGKKGKS